MTETDINPTVLLTGPTSGIGARTLDTLMAHPSRPRLVLLARDAAALDTALTRARDRGLRAHGIRLDLADLGSVRDALDELTAAGLGPIDVAHLNAGAQFTDRRRTGAQGYELTFTVNVIAQHLLLRGLEPMLAPAAHVVLMGSSTHRGKKQSFNLVPDPRWEAPAALATAEPAATGPTRFADEREKGGVAYATSKLALVTLAHEWAARLAASGHRLNTYDPGLVAGTGLGKDMPGYMYWVWKYVMPAMSVLPGATTAATSGRHAAELAMGDAHATLHDGYVEIGRLTRAEAVTFDESRRRELWQWLEGTVAEWLPSGVEAHR
jgi:NAD(P)-dependent dehydrogenase (short-subunit alcohol dehydrogenase family)